MNQTFRARQCLSPRHARTAGGIARSIRRYLDLPGFILVVLFALAANVAAAEPGDVGYVYAYFKGGWPTGGSSGVFLSFSYDGLNFTDLNGGNAVLPAPQQPQFPAGENQTRDPSVVYGPDNKFHMVWTTGITTKTIGYSSSADLKTWSTPRQIVLWDESVDVSNTWAPELFYSKEDENYLIVWASNVDNGPHKLYSVTTANFESFTQPKEFFFDGNTVIDGMIAEDAANDRFVMAIKDELGGKKNIWIASSADASGPYKRWAKPAIGPGSTAETNAVEGPSLLKVGDTWQLHYDAYGAGYLGVATSPDLVNWTNRTSEAKLPSGGSPHHGTVFAAPLEAIGWGIPPRRSDLNQDGEIDLSDWSIFRTHHLADFSGLTALERSARGDLDGDGANNFRDFRLFQRDFDAQNGTNALDAALAQVPECSSAALAVVGAIGLLKRSRIKR